MNHQQDPLIPAVAAWLQEPTGLPPSDVARIAHLVHQTPQQRAWRTIPNPFHRSTPSMFGLIRFVLASAIVAGATGAALHPALLGPSPSVPPVGASPSPAVAEPTPAPSFDAAGALILGVPDDQALGPWSELARRSVRNDDGSSWGELLRMVSIGGLLVALGSQDETDEGPTHDVLLASTDGITWYRPTVPATDPVINDLAASAAGLVAVGSDVVDGARAARVWTSVDGLTWVDAPAPDTKTIDRLYTADLPMTARVGEFLWINRDGSAWERMTRFGDQQLLQGPGGYIAWQTRGERQPFPILLFSSDLTGWQEMGLPEQLSDVPDGFLDIQLFALPDAWVMVPHTEALSDSILVSSDGWTWQTAPRPAGMSAGEVRWIAQVGEQAQAFGADLNDEAARGALWTWTLGEEVPAPAILGSTDEFLNAPVAFRDGHLANGLKMGRGWELTMWQLAG